MSGPELVTLIKKNPISVGCGALAVLLAAGIYFRGSKIPDADAVLAQKSAESERHAGNLKNAAQLKEQMDALVAANKEIDSRVIRAGQRGLNIQFFNKLTGEVGVKLVNFQQGALTASGKGAKTNFNAVSFNLSVNGTYAQLIDFLQRLEGGEHYSRILTANIATVAGNRAGNLTLTLNLELLGLP